MTELEENQENYETNVWDVFRSLGQGCRVYLIRPVNGPTLWVIPPDLGRQAHYYADKDTIDPLLAAGLVKESKENFPPNFDAEVEYVLTDGGASLFTAIDAEPVARGKEVFRIRVNLSRPS